MSTKIRNSNIFISASTVDMRINNAWLVCWPKKNKVELQWNWEETKGDLLEIHFIEMVAWYDGWKEGDNIFFSIR